MSKEDWVRDLGDKWYIKVFQVIHAIFWYIIPNWGRKQEERIDLPMSVYV